MKSILVDVKHGEIKALDIEKSLETYYELLDCDLVDITTRVIGGKPYAIILDDEGLFRDKPQVSAVDSHGEPMLVGNLLIVNDVDTDDGRDLASLSDEDINGIMHNSCLMVGNDRMWPAVVANYD